MKSKQERLIFLERLTEILGEPIEKDPRNDGEHVIEGDIEWHWVAKMSSFAVFIDSEGKIDLQIAIHPNPCEILSEGVTDEEVLKRAKNFNNL